MKPFFATFLALVLVSNSTNAISFYPDYATWRSSGNAERSGYAAGLMEGLAAIGFDDNGTAFGVGLTVCAIKLKLSSTMVADAITKHYENNPKAWGTPARFVFWEQFVLGACLEHINAARRERALKPWNGTSD